MDRFEMAETLRKKAGISYRDAKEALEAAGWDMPQAMENLQRGRGDRKESEMGSTKSSGKAANAAGWLASAFKWMGETIQRGNRNYFFVTRDKKQVFEITVTVAVLLFLLLHGLFVLIILIGLLAGYRCKFISEAEDKAFREDIKAAGDTAEEINQRHAVNSFGEDSGA